MLPNEPCNLSRTRLVFAPLDLTARHMIKKCKFVIGEQHGRWNQILLLDSPTWMVNLMMDFQSFLGTPKKT